MSGSPGEYPGHTTKVFRTLIRDGVSGSCKWNIQGVNKEVVSKHANGRRSLTSPEFTVGDCSFVLDLYLNGNTAGASACFSLFATIRTANKVLEVESFCFSIRSGDKLIKELRDSTGTVILTGTTGKCTVGVNERGEVLPGANTKSFGYGKLVSHEELEKAGAFDEGKLEISCTIATRASGSPITSTVVEESAPVPLEGASAAANGLADDLGRLLDSGNGANVEFAVGDSAEVLRAHRLILSARSPVFAALLDGDYAEGTTRASEPIPVQDVEPPVFAALLRYIYTERFPSEDELTAELLQHLLVASDKYNITALRDECARRLEASLSPDTAAYTLTLAHQHGLRSLKDACVKYASLHAVAMTESEGWAHLMSAAPVLATEVLRTCLGAAAQVPAAPSGGNNSGAGGGQQPDRRQKRRRTR